jgi:phage terminase small subunit
MVKENKKRLSLKQEKFVEAFVDNGGNATQAAMVAYDCANKVDAGNIGRQNLDKPYIKDVIDSKVKDLKDNTLDALRKKDLMNLALDTAHSDLQDDDPKVREAARKYVLEVAKYLSDNEKAPKNDNRTQNLILPSWKSGTGKSK